jgi:hypothetical protein
MLLCTDCRFNQSGLSLIQTTIWMILSLIKVEMVTAVGVLVLVPIYYTVDSNDCMKAFISSGAVISASRDLVLTSTTS